MTEKPMIFNAEMVRAILEGRKTMTRRIVKQVPDYYHFKHCGGPKQGQPKHIMDWSLSGVYQADEDQENYCKKGHFYLDVQTDVDDNSHQEIKCPYGQSGDRIWVRETFSLETNSHGDLSGVEYEPPFKDGRPVKWDGGDWWQPHYRATDPSPELICYGDICRQCDDNGSGPHWKPSIQMPRWASRITLEIVDVRVERLNDITREDAKKEGFLPSIGNGLEQSCGRSFGNAELAFRNTWESIYGPGSWESNPWVWVLQFKRI